MKLRDELIRETLAGILRGSSPLSAESARLLARTIANVIPCFLACLGLLFLGSTAWAQSSSTNFRMVVDTLNTGGGSASSTNFALFGCLAPAPEAGGTSASASFRLTAGCPVIASAGAACGDAVVSSPEACDDGGLDPGDGCSATCTVEEGWECSGQPSDCTPICGDGSILGDEQCDDSNAADGDCCSSSCQLDAAEAPCEDGDPLTSPDLCDGSGVCLPGPTPTPTATPSDTPTNTPTATPTATPTNTPTVTPTATPTATPTDTLTATPTETPTWTPTATPTNTPTATPTNTPTLTPTNTPTLTPTPFCGNGEVDSELNEDCDPAVPSVDDCCAGDCRFSASGSACQDGNPITCPDTCDGSGTCVPGSQESRACDTCDDGVDNDGDDDTDCEDTACCSLGEALRFAVVGSADSGKSLGFGSDVSVDRVSVDATCDTGLGECVCGSQSLNGCTAGQACDRNADCGGGDCAAGACSCPATSEVDCPAAGDSCSDDSDCVVDVAGVCNPTTSLCVCPAHAPTCPTLDLACNDDAECGRPFGYSASTAGVCAYRGDIRAGSRMGFLAAGGDMQFGKGRTVDRVLDLGAQFAFNGDARNQDVDTRNDCQVGRCVKLQPGSTPLIGNDVCSSSLQLACFEDSVCPAAPGDQCSLGTCSGHEESCDSNADCTAACDGQWRLTDGTCSQNPSQQCLFDFECGSGNQCQHPFVSTDGSAENFERCESLVLNDPAASKGVSGVMCRIARGVEAYTPSPTETVAFPASCIVCSDVDQPENECDACADNGAIIRSGAKKKTIVTFGGGVQVLDLDGAKPGISLAGRTQLVLRGQADTIAVIRIPDRGKLQLGPEAKVYAEGIPSEQILWVAEGRRGSVKFNRDVHFVGTVLAPERSSIKVGGNSVVEGALLGKKVSLSGGAVLRHHPFTGKLPSTPAATCD